MSGNKTFFPHADAAEGILTDSQCHAETRTKPLMGRLLRSLQQRAQRLRFAAMLLTSTCLTHDVFAQNANTQNSASQNSASQNAVESTTNAANALSDGYIFDPVTLIYAGLAFGAVILGFAFRSAQQGWLKKEGEQGDKIRALSALVDSQRGMLQSEKHVVIRWPSRNADPEVEGDLGLFPETGTTRRILGFGLWLAPHEARQMENAVEDLLKYGKAFRFSLPLPEENGLVEAIGHTYGGLALLQLRRLEGERGASARLALEHEEVMAENQRLKALLDHLPHPVWIKGANKTLTWVNMAYAKALEVTDRDIALQDKNGFLSQQTLKLLAAHESEARNINNPAPHEVITIAGREEIIAGQKRQLDLIHLARPDGEAVIALDETRLHHAEEQIKQQRLAQSQLLDQMTTAIAVCDRSGAFLFHNQAFRALWQLDAHFTNRFSTIDSCLDHLRNQGKLPEEGDYHSWKREFLSSFSSNETQENGWHFPSGRSIKVVRAPNIDGGVTFIFEDESLQRALETQYLGLSRKQGDTLEALKEGVAVVGSDGHLQLYNQAFAHFWGLERAFLDKNPHIDDIAQIAPPSPSSQLRWRQIRLVTCGLSEKRKSDEFTLEAHHGQTLQCIVTPLPDGGNLLSFADITPILREREALAATEKLRREFLHLVSFELRAPLQNTIGFVELLASGVGGALNKQQSEYASDARRSTDLVLSIINDILNLASIETETLTLDLKSVDVRKTVELSVARLREKLTASQAGLSIEIGRGVEKIMADEQRLWQILYMLLAHAIAHAPTGAAVKLSVSQSGEEILFALPDFAAQNSDEAHSLRISMAEKLARLHGGKIERVIKQGSRQAQIICHLPVNPVVKANAALKDAATIVTNPNKQSISQPTASKI